MLLIGMLGASFLYFFYGYNFIQWRFERKIKIPILNTFFFSLLLKMWFKYAWFSAHTWNRTVKNYYNIVIIQKKLLQTAV